MRKINPSAGYERYDDLDQDQRDEVFKSLSRAQAQALREHHPLLSPWEVLVWQAGVGLVLAMLAWLLSGQRSVGWSALYGVAAVVVPGMVFARGMTSKVSSINPAAAVTGFFVWEAVKIGLVLAMLVAAPRLVANLSWPAMLVGLIVAMKVVWLVLWLHAKARR